MTTLLPPRSFDSSINHQRWYIATEFNRYFPDATQIDVIHRNDGETIDVRVFTDYGSHNIVHDYSMDIGSDDFWYTFIHESADPDFTDVITIPLDANPVEEA